MGIPHVLSVNRMWPAVNFRLVVSMEPPDGMRMQNGESSHKRRFAALVSPPGSLDWTGRLATSLEGTGTLRKSSSADVKFCGRFAVDSKSIGAISVSRRDRVSYRAADGRWSRIGRGWRRRFDRVSAAACGLRRRKIFPCNGASRLRRLVPTPSKRMGSKSGVRLHSNIERAAVHRMFVTLLGSRSGYDPMPSAEIGSANLQFDVPRMQPGVAQPDGQLVRQIEQPMRRRTSRCHQCPPGKLSRC